MCAGDEATGTRLGALRGVRGGAGRGPLHGLPVRAAATLLRAARLVAVADLAARLESGVGALDVLEDPLRRIAELKAGREAAVGGEGRAQRRQGEEAARG